jgi:hypothetical protein
MMPPVLIRILVLQLQLAFFSFSIFHSACSRLLVAFSLTTPWRFEKRLHFFLAAHTEAEFLD